MRFFKQSLQFHNVMQTLISDNDVVEGRRLPAVDVGFNEIEVRGEASFSSKLPSAGEHLRIYIQAVKNKIMDTMGRQQFRKTHFRIAVTGTQAKNITSPLGDGTRELSYIL